MDKKHQKLYSESFEDFMSSDRFLDLERLPERPIPAHQPTHGGAKLASVVDLERFLSAPDELHPFRFSQVSLLTSGQSGAYLPIYNKSVYFPETVRRQNTMIISKIGGGKTTRYLLPSLFEDIANRNSSVFWIDTKGDIEPIITQWMKFARPGEKPVVLNFADIQRTTHSINLIGDNPPLDELFEDVSAFCDAATESNSAKDSPFWSQTGARWLVACLQLLQHLFGKASLADAHFLIEGDIKRLMELLDRHQDQIHFASGMLSSLRSGSHNADTNVVNLGSYLRHFINRNVCATTSHSELKFDHLFRKPTVFILEINQADVIRYRPLFNMFISQLFRAISKFAEKCPNNRLPRPLNAYADDFAALGRVNQAESYINTLRSRDFRFSVAIQSMEQMSHLYGPAAQELMAGFGTKIFQPHLEQADAEWASRHAGHMTAVDIETSGTSDGQILEHSGRSVPRKLLTPDEIILSPYHWSYGCRAATVFAPDTPPFQAWFRPFYDIEQFQCIGNDLKRKLKIRRKSKILYSPPKLHPSPEPEPAKFTVTTGWSKSQIKKRLSEVLLLLNWNTTEEGPREFWIEFELENSCRLALVLRLAEELYYRRSNLTEFFEAVCFSKTRNIRAALHYLDFLRASKTE